MVEGVKRMMTTMSAMTERMPGMGMGTMGGPSGTMMPTNMMMMPRCTFKVEKVKDGMKITCSCSDTTACATLQNLCQMLQGGMCSLCCVMNGMMVCTCNLTMGMCKCEMTKDGCCVTCTSGDKACCEMIQSCCDCVATMMKSGCTCCMMMNNTPVCCGTC